MLSVTPLYSLFSAYLLKERFMQRLIFRQNWWNSTPKHNDTWTHFLKIISWADNSSSKKHLHLNRQAKLLNHVAQAISSSLLGYHSDYEWCQSHYGEERNNGLRKLPLLVSWSQKHLFCLWIFFLWRISRSHLCCFCMRCILTLFISGQYFSFCLPWASVDFMDSFICHFTFKVNKIHGLATCLFWHTPDRMEQEHKHSFSSCQRHQGG